MKPIYMKPIVISAIAEATLQLYVAYPRVLCARLLIEEHHFLMLQRYHPSSPFLKFLCKDNTGQFVDIPVALIKQHIPRINWLVHQNISIPKYFSWIKEKLNEQWFMESSFQIRFSQSGMIIFNDSFEEVISSKFIPNYDFYGEPVEWIAMMKGKYGDTIEHWLINASESP